MTSQSRRGRGERFDCGAADVHMARSPARRTIRRRANRAHHMLMVTRELPSNQRGAGRSGVFGLHAGSDINNDASLHDLKTAETIDSNCG